MLRWLWQWGPAVAWMSAIFVVSGMPAPPPMPADLPYASGHFVAYALLAVLLARAVAGARWSGVRPTGVLASWSMSAVYALSDEWHQSFVPGRTAALEDWLADLAGATIGLLLLWIARRRATRADGPSAGRAV